MTDDIKKDEVAFSQDELAELKKHGIDDDKLDDIVQAVHDELSSNANLKNTNTQYHHLSFVPFDGVRSLVFVSHQANFAKTDDVPTTTHHKPSNTPSGLNGLSSSISTKAVANQSDDTTPVQPSSQSISKKTDQDQDISDTDNTKDKEKHTDIVRTLIAKKHSEKTIDHKSVRIGIEAGALPTKMFFIMNGLSAVIAGYGLLANSPAVVIGAMLVAMMLGPITGAALAVIDARLSLLRRSLMTLVGGVLVIYAVGMVLGFLYPENVSTAEIMSRTSPTTMDLMVALAGGAAGAYAMVSPNLSVAVVGVAVATALVPPLTASGILLSAGHWELAMGALLLAITNMLAIQFTNALVLWFAGFRRVLDDETDNKWGQAGTFLKRNSAVLLLLIIIGAYLSVNFKHTMNQQNFERQTTELIEKHIEQQANYLLSTSFTQENKTTIVRAVIQGVDTPNSRQALLLEKDIQALADDAFKQRQIKLQIRFVPEIVIQSTPVDESELKLSPKDIENLHR